MPSLQLQLQPSSLTLTIQLLARVGGAAVGAPIAGVYSANVYNFNLGATPAGDYDVQIAGLSTPEWLPFPMRLTSAGIIYQADYWWQIDTAIPGGVPAIPSPIAGLCSLLVSASDGPDVVPGARVQAQFEDDTNNTDAWLISRAVNSGVTDEDGFCTLRLIQFGQFAGGRGGIYRIRVYDPNGDLMYDRRVKMPDTTDANLAAIPDA